MKDNTEQAFSHCFLSTYAQHFPNMNFNDANIQQSRPCKNKVNTDQARCITRTISCGTKAGKLARLGSQSEHRIGFIFPARGFSHVLLIALVNTVLSAGATSSG